MRYRLLLILISISIMLGTDIKAAEQNDTIYNPTVVFTGMPKKYEIAGIRVTGLQNYEDYIVIGYSGLAVGDIIEIPGDEITNAAKRFWRQGLFSKIQIRVEKICGDKAWLLFDLRQQPRISQINYHGYVPALFYALSLFSSLPRRNTHWRNALKWHYKITSASRMQPTTSKLQP